MIIAVLSQLCDAWRCRDAGAGAPTDRADGSGSRRKGFAHTYRHATHHTQTRWDVIRIDAHYYVGSDDDRLNYSDGTHLNVMAYMYTAYHGASDASEGTNQTLSLPAVAYQ